VAGQKGGKKKREEMKAERVSAMFFSKRSSQLAFVFVIASVENKCLFIF